MSIVSVVIPSLGRPDRLQKCLDRLFVSAPDVEAIVVADNNDMATIRVARETEPARLVTVSQGTGPVEAWNIGASHATGDYLVLGADDLVFHDGWYEVALGAMAKKNGYGLVAFNDLSPLSGRLATHYMVSRAYAVNEWGGFLAAPYYKQQFIDNEATERAKRDNCFIYAQSAIVEHMHPLWEKADHDDTYNAAITDSRYEYGEQMFLQRAADGFPNEHKPYFDMRVPERDGWGSVAVAARRYKYSEPQWVASWTEMIAGGMRQGDRILKMFHGQPGHIAANVFARSFLNTRCNSLLLVDDDMEFSPGALEALRSNEQNWHYDIVMGFCTHKTMPPHAVVMLLQEEQPGLPVSLMGERYGAMRDIPNNTVIDVDAVGLAFTLIKRHVLEAMVNQYGAIYTSWFGWGEHSEGEDITFSRRCRELGFSLAVDTNVKIGHVGHYVYGWDAFNDWQYQERNKEK